MISDRCRLKNAFTGKVVEMCPVALPRIGETIVTEAGERMLVTGIEHGGALAAFNTVRFSKEPTVVVEIIHGVAGGSIFDQLKGAKP